MRQRLFRLPTRRPEAIASDVDAEIRLHLDLRIAELMAGGMARDAAEREALSRFGPYDSARADLLAAARQRERKLTILDHLDSLKHDLAYAARQIRRAPGLAVAVTLTFALGIGANATMFGIIDRLLLRPPAHVRAPEALVWIGTLVGRGGDQFTNTGFSYPVFQELRDGVPAFSHVAMHTFPSEVSYGLGEHARRVNVVMVSGRYFELMGAPMVLGRPIARADNALPSGQPVAVISHGFWQREFGADPAIVGSDITLANGRYSIIGVAPRGFIGTQTRPIDVWLPVAAAEGIRFAQNDWATIRSAIWMDLVARLAPGASPELATAQVTSVIRAGREKERGTRDTTSQAVLTSVLPSQQPTLSAEKRVAVLLGAVSVLVLLIACANVANLLLVRAIARRREIAVRVALGIARARLVRQLVVESALLASVGGLSALLVVHWGSMLVQRVLLSQYAWPDSAVDGRMLLFTAAATVAVGLLSGLAPAFQGSAPDLSHALKEGTRGAGLSRSRLRSALLIAQAAFAVVLLVGTGLFVRSLRNVHDVDLGVDVGQLIAGEIDLRSVGYDTVASKEYFARSVEAVRRIPGVTSAVAATAAPFTEWSMGTRLRTPDRDSLPRPLSRSVRHVVMPGYFATTGTRIVLGRDFTAAETAPGGERVAIINETAARGIWPGRDALGECILVSNDRNCVRLVGIAEDTHRSSITDEQQTQVYLPYGAWPHGQFAMTIIARTTGDPADRVEPVRRVMQTVMPGLPYANVRPMMNRLSNELRPWRLGATMFGVFGAIAIVLSALGLYSVIAYSVVQRTHEMGVRVALGARGTDIRRLVVSQGVRLAAVGAALGIFAALAAGRFVESLLYEVSPHDPAVLAGVVALVLSVSVAASLVPARRATRADPLEALRAD